jgi:hypothetical protein
VYSTCIYCKRPLGTNEVIESFPVGRRLAYDPAKGRLWVVCRKCERWNLSPLEERWEAFEECERRFRATRLRASTDQIGLARLSEGLELVRVGEPMRPEFAAWRYGDQFGRRRRRAIMWTTGAIAAVAAITAGGIAAGIGAGFAPQIPNLILNIPLRARVRTRDGRILKFRNTHLQKARFLMEPGSSEWLISVKHSKGTETFAGKEAMTIASHLLPAMNHMAGSPRHIQTAVAKIEQAGHPEQYLASVSKELDPDTWRAPGVGKPLFTGKMGTMHKLPAPTRLALEMALHEEQEMRAMMGELVELELAWREAEEIAGISDDMFVPKATEEFLEKHHPPTAPTKPPEE